MYKSIFERIKHYSTNPINEHHKISSFISTHHVDNLFSLKEALADAFTYCKELRGVYPSFDNCIDENTYNICRQSTMDISVYGERFTDDQKEAFLEEFLTFCQIILTTIKYFDQNMSKILQNHFVMSINRDVIDQLVELISNSLKCFNYRYVEQPQSLIVDIAYIDPVAEVVANMSPTNISDAITGYLGNRDIKTKEKFLHDLVDLLEPTLNKYDSQSIIKKIREYVQLIRHPETKKDSAQYAWFYQNKKRYMDKLFSLCVFVQQYSVSKEIIEEFEDNKNNANC